MGKFIFNIKEISQKLREPKRSPESGITSDGSPATHEGAEGNETTEPINESGQMPELGTEISGNSEPTPLDEQSQPLGGDELPQEPQIFGDADINAPYVGSPPELAPEIDSSSESTAAPVLGETSNIKANISHESSPVNMTNVASNSKEAITSEGSPVELTREMTEESAGATEASFSVDQATNEAIRDSSTGEVNQSIGALVVADGAEELETSEAGELNLVEGEAASELPAKKPQDQPLYRRLYFWVGLGGIAIAVGAGGIGVALWNVEKSLPDTAEIFSFVRDGSLTISAGDGTILQQIGPATREKLKIDKIPQRLIEAFVASEDSRFYDHHGIDYQGIVRATVSNILAREVVQGASTITQQLARVVFLTQERNLGRKLREAMLAMKLERELTKEQLLEQYLNHVYLGSGAYGVADAAWVYFSKSVQDLTLGEMASIAGLPPAPSDYSPLVNPNVARERRNLVLKRMVEVGYITPEEAAAAAAEPLAVKPSEPKRLVVEAPYFTSYILKELPKYVSADELEVGGLTVETTINRQWQKMAEEAVKEVVDLDGPAEGFEQGALVAIDPRNGEVKAMVGGRDYTESEFNRVTQAQRQPGSTFKGFVYATAIAAGFSPYDSYEDANFIVDGYKPRNYSGKYRGWMSLRDALASSINVVAVKTLIDVGFEPVIKLAHDMGIKSELKPTYSLALGGSEVNLLELTSAYGTIAARGKHVQAHGIVRVTNRRGKVIYEAKFQPKTALDPDSASIMDWMLEGVINYGTGGAAQLWDRPVAGKTGTSDEAKDLWFIGYIPQMVAGVWLGNDDSYPTWGSSSTAAYAWRRFMEEAAKDMKVEEFPELPELDGRKATIKAQPVTPEYTVYGDTNPDKPEDAEKTDDDTGDNTGYY